MQFHGTVTVCVGKCRGVSQFSFGGAAADARRIVAGEIYLAAAWQTQRIACTCVVLLTAAAPLSHSNSKPSRVCMGRGRRDMLECGQKLV